jgi:aminoglycoside 3-N-acetyltransferase
MHSRSHLAADFRELGVAPGDTVMLHASVRAVGPVAGGPDQIHLALKQALTSTGSLLMYASCPRHYDEVGRGNLTPEEEREVLAKLPPFDPLTARADRGNGALVELFRTYPGSRVNPHVARFVVWGRKADYLISTQPWHYAFGRGSALERFVELDGKILLLGSDHDAVTFLHYAEHVLDVPDKRVARFQVPVEENNARVWRWAEEVDSNQGAHSHWPERFFAKLVDGYLARTENRGGLVGGARSHLFQASGLLAHALAVMREVVEDPRAAAGLGEQAAPP